MHNVSCINVLNFNWFGLVWFGLVWLWLGFWLNHYAIGGCTFIYFCTLWDRQYYLFLSLLIVYSELFCALHNSETCHLSSIVRQFLMVNHLNVMFSFFQEILHLFLATPDLYIQPAVTRLLILILTLTNLEIP